VKIPSNWKKQVLPYFAIVFLSFTITFGLHWVGAFSLLETEMYDFRFHLRGPLSGWDSNSAISKKAEPFQDINSNGKWDNQEPFNDYGNGFRNQNESFTDANKNGIWDDDEVFSDKGNGVRDTGLDIVLVEIDDESHRLMPDPYPYPRGRVWAQVIRNLTLAGAKVIVFDIQFDAHDPTSRIIENNFPDLVEEQHFIHGDIEFAKAISFAKDQGTEIVLASKIGFETNRIPPDYLVKPTAEIMKQHPKIGLVDHEVDKIDNVSRRYSIFNVLSEDLTQKHYSIAVQTVLSYMDIPDKTPIIQDLEKNTITIGSLEITPFRQEASFLLDFYGPNSNLYDTFTRFSLISIIDTKHYDLIDEWEDDDWMDKYIDESHPLFAIFGGERNPFRDKIIMIGSSLKEDHDFKETPYFSYDGGEHHMPGVEFHANAVQQLIHQNYISVPTGTLKLHPLSFWQHVLIILLLVLVTTFSVYTLSPVRGLILTIIFGFTWLSVSVGAFFSDYIWIFKFFFQSIFSEGILNNLGKFSVINVPNFGESTLLPTIFPLASIIITYGLNLSYKLISEQQDKKFLKDTFGTYVSPELIDKMYEGKEKPKLGGESGRGTAFFSDIQSFTTISESLIPHELVELLNEYFTIQTNLLLDHQGTLDKYEGDGILAFFGAPVKMKDHARQAIITGIEMINALGVLRKKWKSENRWTEKVQNMRIRIGINEGEMVTGNIGSTLHMNYTMMGDVVNLASRLESGAKQYGIYFHCTYHTLVEAGISDFLWREVDNIQFVGKTESHRTVEVLGYRMSATDDQLKMIDYYHDGLKHYRKMDWKKAIGCFKKSEKLEEDFPTRNTNPSKVMLEKCEALMENPPPNNWVGISILLEK